MAANDITGKVFGNLTAIRPAGTTPQGVVWEFSCACGSIRVTWPFQAKKTGHCGCETKTNLRNRPKKHGQLKTAGYRIWDAMKQRCLNPKTKHYNRYGGRGITVCERWLDFRKFIEDMGQPESGQTIDRINNDGNYEPDNCRWATRKEQSRNNSRNRLLALNGRVMPLVCWAEEIGICEQVLRSRLSRGWSSEKTLTTPRLSQGIKNHDIV